MMTSKERALTAFARVEPDRVPVDYSANPGIDARLKEHFGLAQSDRLGLLEALGVDFRGVGAPYVGPKLHEDVPERLVNEWGIRRRKIEHDTGAYWDFCDFVLEHAALDEIEAWPMPSPDDYDYSRVATVCETWKDYCIVAGGAGLGDVINSTGMVRTMQQVMIDLATEDEAFWRYVDRKIAIQAETLRRTLEAAKGGVDLVCMGEDLGTQRGPLISLDMYRATLRPWHQTIVDIARSFDLPVMIHSCGSSSWVFDDFIDMGISIVDTLQPEATNMAPAYLKGRFGDRLAFHGCVSTAGPVAHGTVEEAVEHCRHTLDVMMPGGGYAFAPTHQLQDNSPTENVVAMYRVAREHGQYSGLSS